MPTIETNDQQRPEMPAGVYRHPETGQEMVAVKTAKFGNPQASAYTRMGFEYVGELKESAKAKPESGEPGKVEVPTEPSAPEFNVPDTPPKSPAELEAELQAAKAREAEAAKRSANSLAESPKESKKEGGAK